jgi:hypothetical protein
MVPPLVFLWMVNIENYLQSHPGGSTTTTDEVIVDEPPGRSVGHVKPGKSRLLRMVKDIESLDAIFQLQVLAQPERLKETEVDVLHRI